tara:strand:- start:437 stop:541 length:105 start_codon:yes stop_codon:yes gene_type:complete
MSKLAYSVRFEKQLSAARQFPPPQGKSPDTADFD